MNKNSYTKLDPENTIYGNKSLLNEAEFSNQQLLCDDINHENFMHKVAMICVGLSIILKVYLNCLKKVYRMRILRKSKHF